MNPLVSISLGVVSLRFRWSRVILGEFEYCPELSVHQFNGVKVLKIPFAIDSKSGELVDIGQVKKGRECGCNCPSCGQPVVARQGELNQWHFAHDTKALVSAETMCEISFYACCKRFVVEFLLLNELKILSTPSYLATEKRHPFSTKGLEKTVTSSKKLAIDLFSKDSEFDVLAKMGAHSIGVVLDYPGRSLPKVDSGSKGVLLIDLRYIAENYESMHATPVLLRKLVCELIAEVIEGKRWLFHPREVVIREGLRERLATEFPELEQNYTQSQICIQKIVECAMCKRRWACVPGVPPRCAYCKTHLYLA